MPSRNESAREHLPQPVTDPLAVFAPGSFDGSVALVTGGGKGIGRTTSLSLARLGADVVIAARDERALREVADEVHGLGRECLAIPTDIRQPEQVDALRLAVDARFGRVDILVNNAGGQFMAPPNMISDRGWRSVVDLNLNGTWTMCQRFMFGMCERGSGAIVNVVHNGVGERGSVAFVHSGAARAGVVNMTRSLAPYLQLRGVRINAIAPGFVPTQEMLQNYGVTEEELGAMVGRAPLGSADDVAAAIVFLCSPAARLVNGALLVVDGAAMSFNLPATDMFLDG